MAEGLFHSQGYARTTLDQIAARLGVTKPYLYYYFHNKQQLFEQLSWTPAVACFTVLDDGSLAHLPPHLQCAQALKRLIAATLGTLPGRFFLVPRAAGLPARIPGRAKAPGHALL